MAFKHYLILFLSLLIVGCAEVGSISGGPKDEIAPKIIRTTTLNGTTNFKSQLIEITFDEFVQLNKPTESIFLVPKHAQLEAQLIKKTLKIKLSNELEKNTTYTLYLNGAVEDVTEGNDSLIQFTFSTGPKLDSLKFSARTLDAFSNQTKSKVTVGLFDSLNAENPIYFGQSDQAGLITLSAIKEGTYYCKAFDDKNKDLQIQKDEAQDWIFEPIIINENPGDTLILALSSPLQPDKIKNPKVLSPGLIGLHVPIGIGIDKISLNGTDCLPNHYWRQNEDSLLIVIGNRTENEFQLIVNSDSFNLRRLEKNKLVKLNPKNTTNEKEISNVSHFEVMDLIESIDSGKIVVLKLPDSLRISYIVSFEQNRLSIQPKDKAVRKYNVIFKEGSVTGLTGKKSNLSKIEIVSKEEREFGSLNVKLSQFIESGFLQILNKDKVIDEQKITSSDKPIVFTRLNPGDYTFRIIEDSNKNGKWDPISPEKKLKSERVLQFSNPIKVRANWEVETLLELKN
jgi:hypothetical protein